MRTHGFKIVPFFCQKLDLYFKGESGSDGCIVKGVACCLCTRDLTLIPWDPKTEHWTNFSQLCSNIYIFLLALWQVIAHKFSCGFCRLNFLIFYFFLGQRKILQIQLDWTLYLTLALQWRCPDIISLFPPLDFSPLPTMPKENHEKNL